MSEAVRVVHLSGEVWHVEEKNIEWPDDTQTRTLTVYDLMSFMNIRPSEYDLIPLLPTDQTPAQTMIMDSDDIVQWGRSYTLVKRHCHRCTLCNKACERASEHTLCSHGCSYVADKCALHLWHHLSNGNTQGYLNGCGLESFFPANVIRDELCSLCAEFQFDL